MKEKEVLWAAKIIREGGIVAFPTETVYGLGADVFNPLAVARIFEVKQSPYFDPLIVHIDDPTPIETLVKDVPLTAKELIERYWPGPLTIVLLKKDKIELVLSSYYYLYNNSLKYN